MLIKKVTPPPKLYQWKYSNKNTIHDVYKGNVKYMSTCQQIWNFPKGVAALIYNFSEWPWFLSIAFIKDADV